MKQLRAIGRKMAVHDRGQDLGAAQPAAQTNELGKFLVVHFVHRLLHAILRLVQLLANAGPVPLVGRIGDGLRVRAQHDKYAIAPLTYEESSRIPNYERRNPPLKLQDPLSPAASMTHIQVPPGFRLTAHDASWKLYSNCAGHGGT